jgi:predicted DNA-binding transcriptional regulator AlpA
MQDTDGGAGLCQTDSGGATRAPRVRGSTGPSASAPLLSAEQAARDVFGVSVRTFHELRSQPWMPEPVVLGPRILRWVRAELEEALTKMPRTRRAPDPWPQRASRTKSSTGRVHRISDGAAA